jgi:hypothetical protein
MSIRLGSIVRRVLGKDPALSGLAQDTRELALRIEAELNALDEAVTAAAEAAASAGITALTGDVTASGTGSVVATIANLAVTTAKIAANAVTFAKIQTIATDSLIGRDTAGTGDPESITVGGGIEFNGSGALRTAAFTGDVTKTAGGTALTIANDAVTYAKMQNVSATDKVLGRSSAGAGDVEEITCTSAGRALIDDADAAAQRVTLGVAAANYIGTYASRPSGETGQIAAFTDGVVSQIYDGSAWRNYVNGVVCKVPPAIAGMTALNAGSLTVTDLTGTWKAVKTTATAQTSCYYQAGAGSTFKVTAAFSDLTSMAGVGTYTGQGVMMRESGTGKLVTWELQHQLSTGLVTMIRKRWTNATTFVSAIDNTTPINEWKPIFLRIEYDGTNILYRYSKDLTNWRTVTSEAKTTPFTTAPDQCGVSWYADGVTGESYCVHYENV